MSATPADAYAADVAAVMALVWALVRSGPNFDGRDAGVQQAVEAAIDNAVAAERERLIAWMLGASKALERNGNRHGAFVAMAMAHDVQRNGCQGEFPGLNAGVKRVLPAKEE